MLLILTGCARASSITPITRNLSFTAEVTYYNEFYEISGEINHNGQMTLNFLEPEALKDIVFTITDNNIKAYFKGISYDYNSPQQSDVISCILSQLFCIMMLISFIYNAFKEEAPTVYENDNDFFTKGKFDDFEYKLFIGQSGLPLKIIDSSGRFNVVFKNPSIKK